MLRGGRTPAIVLSEVHPKTPWYLEQNALVFDLKRLHVFLKRLDVFKNALTRHGVRSDTTVAGLLPPETSCKPSSKVAVTGVKAI